MESLNINSLLEKLNDKKSEENSNLKYSDLENFESPNKFEDNYEDESQNVFFSEMDSSSVFDEDVKEQGLFLTEIFSSALKKSQTHLVEVKKKLLNDKRKELQVRDVFYTEQMKKQQLVLNKLSENLAIAEKHNERNLNRFDIIAEKLATFSSNKKSVFDSKYSLLRIFTILKDNMHNARRNRVIYKLSNFMKRKSLISKGFLMISREYVRNKTEKKQAAIDLSYDNLVKDIIKKYEGELAKVNQDLQEAHDIIRIEQSRRQQLEEDLRRTFLKNMSNLNMEALNIFQSSYSQDSGSKSSKSNNLEKKK